MTEPLIRTLVREVLADPEALRMLQEAIGPQPEPAPPVPAYTAVTLGRITGMGARAIRNAITRGELPARKRSGRWVVTGEDVKAWLGEPEGPTRPPQRRAPRPRPLGSTFDGIEGWR